SFETRRCRYSSASGPVTATNARGRRAAAESGVTIGTAVSLETMPLFRSRAEQKVRDAGYDPSRLPPGQYLTEKWPVLHAGSVPDVDLATWDFRVFGEVENPIVLDWEELRRLPSTE